MNSRDASLPIFGADWPDRNASVANRPFRNRCGIDAAVAGPAVTAVLIPNLTLKYNTLRVGWELIFALQGLYNQH